MTCAVLSQMLFRLLNHITSLQIACVRRRLMLFAGLVPNHSLLLAIRANPHALCLPTREINRTLDHIVVVGHPCPSKSAYRGSHGLLNVNMLACHELKHTSDVPCPWHLTEHLM